MKTITVNFFWVVWAILAGIFLSNGMVSWPVVVLIALSHIGIEYTFEKK